MFKTKFEKEYLRMKRESEWQQMEEEVKELKELIVDKGREIKQLQKEIYDLTNELDKYKKQSESTEQAITECFTAETIETANIIKDCKTVIIKSRVMRTCAVEAIKKEFKEVGINAIILPNDCKIDYIC